VCDEETSCDGGHSPRWAAEPEKINDNKIEPSSFVIVSLTVNNLLAFLFSGCSGNSENNSCRCPRQFSARHTDGSCVCECFDKQRDCIRAKRGKEFLPHDDRM
jgi:hypothetical protein